MPAPKPGLHRTPKERPCHAHCAKMLSRYSDYLRDVVGAAPATINLRRYYVGFFLTDGLRHRCTPRDLRGLHPHVIHRYVIRVSATLRRTSKQHINHSIRSFLRFAQVRGWVDVKLREAVPVINTPADARVPTALSWQEVKKLLAAPDRRTRIGKRDYAILQLIANYGVRIGQAMRLKAADIDWSNRTIRFVRVKNGKDLVFPLLLPVANAVLDYLRARGPTAYPDVFLAGASGGRPQRPFGTWTHLNDNISGYYAKAGITAPRVGFHAVRHAVATRLLNKGMPFKMIADMLGHRSIESTYIYTKVELDGLRQVASEWPLFVWPR